MLAILALRPLPVSSSLLKKWVAPAGCDFEPGHFSQILVAPGNCDPLCAISLQD